MRLSHCLQSFAILVWACATSAAQSPLILPGPAENPPKEAAPAAPVADKRAENAELLRIAQRKLEATNPTDSTATQEVAHEVAVYQSLDAVLAQQETLNQQIADLTARQAELEGQLKSAAASNEAPSTTFSFSDFDRLKDELAAERGRASLAEDKLAGAKTALENAQRVFEESERKRRQAQESLEIGQQGTNAAELAAVAEQARQAAKLARETITLRQKEVAREQTAKEVQRLAVQIVQKKIAQVSPSLQFTEENYQTEIEAVKKKEDSANRILLRAQTNLHAAEKDLLEAQRPLETEQGDKSLSAEKTAAQRWAKEKLTDEIDALAQRLQRLAQLRVAWSRRFQIASAGKTSVDKQAWDELKSWQKETQSILDELSANLRNQILRMRDLRSSLTSISKKAEASKDAPPELMEWIDKQRTHVEAAMRVHERNLGSIEDSRRVHEKLLDEIGQRVQTLSATLLAYGAWSQVEKVWGYELAKVEEDGLTRQITVGKIVTALLILLVGWVLARIVSALFANRLLKRFRLSKDAVAALRTLVFYALLIVVALVALRWVNVPLTAFTILGGALAIGVGFGSQALITNFIGGLIMLAERPVRLGERISFGSYDGVVEDVGFRCTKLRTSNDHLVTIPNSALVNDSIENMARSRMIRRLLNVTLTYDTPREKVAAAVQAIRDILDEKELREKIHPIVGFEEFPPRVHFNDFNAESLNIQVMYWYAPPESWAYLEHCERVNYRIMEAFERIGVEFAFPSRTLYLAGDPQRDLASRLLSNGNDPNRSAA